MASGSRSLATLKPSHGISDISAATSRIADLRLKICGSGTFQEFNDVAATLSRVCYMDFVVNQGRSVYLSTAESIRIDGISLSLHNILSRIPGLDALYRMTFGTDALAASMCLQPLHQSSDCFHIQMQDRAAFNDRQSLKRIVDRFRDRFPVLKGWRLTQAQYTWGDTTVWFENLPVGNLDEFSEGYAICANGIFQHTPTDNAQRFRLKEGLDSAAGFVSGGTYLISPIEGVQLSEFSLQYLALFLLSSLVRYRPQIWAHAIARSTFAEKPADDKMLSLIEKFLETNRNSIPELTVHVLNPSEDFYSRYDEV